MPYLEMLRPSQGCTARYTLAVTMTHAQSGSSEAARAAATRIVHVLRDHGHIAYFAGGCVRDELLGVRPTDFDIATDATPDQLQSIFTRTSQVGASFGVVLVRESHVTVEVATFRADGPYSDRRRPDHVKFSDPESDARRRDFTINAIFLDPLAAPQQQIIDYVGGRADLAARVLRAVGDPEARLQEDHLRALRAVRFAARLGFAIEPATAEAIRRHASELSGVSRERIGEELRRMLAHPSRAAACEMLNALTLDAAVFDEPWRPVNLMLVSTLEQNAGPMLALAAYLIDRAGLDVHAASASMAGVRRAVCLSNEESTAVGGILQVLQRLRAEWGDMSIAAQKRLASHPRFSDAHVLLCGWEPALHGSVARRVQELSSDGIGIAPSPFVSGDDLIADGFRPNPQFNGILDRVYDSQLAGEVSTKVTALELARRLRV